MNTPPLFNCFKKVARAGLEPARHYWQGILSPQRLPIPPPSHQCYSAKNRKKKRSPGGLARFFTLDFSLARDSVLSTFPHSSTMGVTVGAAFAGGIHHTILTTNQLPLWRAV